MRFGREMSRLRRIARYTQARVAKEVGVSHGHIGNVENGKRTPDLRLVADLDRVLRAEGRLERLWATLTGDGEPVWLDDLEEVERRATSIMETHTVLFPALIQTEDYARAVARTTTPWAAPNEIEETVKTRLVRAQRFADSHAPVYRLVIPASVVTYHHGRPELLTKQLEHVAGLAERERIDVQVVRPWCHPGLIGPFMLLSSAGAPDVVYAESAYAGRIIDDPDQVQKFRVLLSDLRAVALSPEDSLQLIREETERLNHG